MKKSLAAVQLRRNEILAQLKTAGSVSVNALSRLFAVSESTIRRDLESLEQEGTERFHGGIKIAREERRFEEKNATSASLKEAIARRAAAMVRDGQTVFLNAGTTTLALYRQLKNRDLCIVTNNVAITADPEPGRAELILVGGQYRAKSRSLVGGLASSGLAQIFAHICFLGANGVSEERGLTTLLLLEAEVNRAMGERAERVVCIADSSKIGVDAGFVSWPMEKLSALITDPGADAALLDRLRRRHIEVVLSGAAEGAGMAAVYKEVAATVVG